MALTRPTTSTVFRGRYLRKEIIIFRRIPPCSVRDVINLKTESFFFFKYVVYNHSTSSL